MVHTSKNNWLNFEIFTHDSIVTLQLFLGDSYISNICRVNSVLLHILPLLITKQDYFFFGIMF